MRCTGLNNGPYGHRIAPWFRWNLLCTYKTSYENLLPLNGTTLTGPASTGGNHSLNGTTLTGPASTGGNHSLNGTTLTGPASTRHNHLQQMPENGSNFQGMHRYKSA